MPLEPGKLRRWIAVAGVLLIVVLVGFYSYARHIQKYIGALSKIEKLKKEIQQSANGFSFSKSEGGHTLFTVRADKAIQYKDGNHAELQNASIIVYGRRSDRYDQIYGSKFDYNPSTGIVVAEGEVQIDLQSNNGGADHPDQMQPEEVKNPVHLKTSGLTFNQKTGIAHTTELVEFRVPQGHGSARGADFDSDAGTLVLGSSVDFVTSLEGTNHAQQPTELKADHAILYQHDNQVKLDRAEMRQPDRLMQANKVVVTLRRDNTIERIEATGDVRSTNTQAKQQSELHADEATFQVLAGNHLQSATMNGNVTLNLKRPEQPDSNGRADHAEISFNSKNQVEKVHAQGGVDFTQVRSASGAQAAESREVKADGLDADVRAGNQIDRIVTSGAAQVILVSSQSPGDARKNQAQTRTVVTAGTLMAQFDANNHLHSVHGAPDSRIVSTTAGEPDRVSTAERMDVEFAPSSEGKNSDSIQSAVQEGSFHYRDGLRDAWAEKAQFAAASDQLTLTGSPRVADTQSSITAQEIVLNRATNETTAHGDVRATYLNSKSQANGGMLSTTEATHVTAPAMNANSKTGLAVFTGGARLWQSSNAIEAPQIEFSKTARSLVAHSNPQQQIACSFVIKSQSGKLAPMRIEAAQLEYSDVQRRARFSGGVKTSGEDGIMRSDGMDVLLKPVNAAKTASTGSGATSTMSATGASEIDQIIASGNVTLEQPERKASGDRLVYISDSGQTTLTGSPGHLPSMTDAEHGTVTGDSLTFYNHDDRVVIDSNGTSRTITQTRVKK